MAAPSNINSPVSKARILIAFAAVYFIWGSTYLAIRFSIETIPSLLSGGLRFFIAGIVLYIFARYVKKEPAAQQKHWQSAFILGALMLLGGNGCVVLAEHYVPSGLAALFIALVPLWMVLLEWWWHKTQRPSLGIFFGIGIGFLGVWLLMAPNLLHVGAHQINLFGAALLLLASFSWSIGSLYSRKAHLPKSPFLSTGIQMIAGGGLMLFLSVFHGEWTHLASVHLSFKSIAALIYLIVGGSLIALTSYLWLLKHVGVARTSTYALVNPVVAIFLGCAFAGEQLDTQTILAAFLVLVAVIVITIYHRTPKIVRIT